MEKTIDELLETSYWIVDILPKQVPKDSPGQYFPLAEYFSVGPPLAAIKRRHLNLILKLNCYRDISLDEEPERNPAPARIAETVFQRYTYIRIGDAMLLSEPDDTHMTLFHPDEELLNLVKTLAVGEGLYVWQPEDGKREDPK